MSNLGMIGAAAALGISAVCSAIGLAFAGVSTLGAWKRCYMNNKEAPFILLAFAGAPLTQTIYGFILMRSMLASTSDPLFLLGLGIAAGFGIGASAIAQGKASAVSADSVAETGKGAAQALMIIGLCETVAVLVMGFGMTVL